METLGLRKTEVPKLKVFAAVAMIVVPCLSVLLISEKALGYGGNVDQIASADAVATGGGVALYVNGVSDSKVAITWTDTTNTNGVMVSGTAWAKDGNKLRADAGGLDTPGVNWQWEATFGCAVEGEIEIENPQGQTNPATSWWSTTTVEVGYEDIEGTWSAFANSASDVASFVNETTTDTASVSLNKSKQTLTGNVMQIEVSFFVKAMGAYELDRAECITTAVSQDTISNGFIKLKNTTNGTYPGSWSMD